MALYKVSRTDDVQPGEFVDAVVIAGGVAQARNAVSHMTGVTKKNTIAQRVDTAAETRVLATYFDERETAPVTPTDGFGY